MQLLPPELWEVIICEFLPPVNRDTAAVNWLALQVLAAYRCRRPPRETCWVQAIPLNKLIQYEGPEIVPELRRRRHDTLVADVARYGSRCVILAGAAFTNARYWEAMLARMTMYYRYDAIEWCLEECGSDAPRMRALAASNFASSQRIDITERLVMHGRLSGPSPMLTALTLALIKHGRFAAADKILAEGIVNRKDLRTNILIELHSSFDQWHPDTFTDRCWQMYRNCVWGARLFTTTERFDWENGRMNREAAWLDRWAAAQKTGWRGWVKRAWLRWRRRRLA